MRSNRWPRDRTRQQHDSFVLDLAVTQDGPFPRERVPPGTRGAIHEKLTDHAFTEIDPRRCIHLEVVEAVAVCERIRVERTEIRA